jgi:GNAT superfamily N-acetyltransferase
MEYVEITEPGAGEVIQFHDMLVEAFPDPYVREDVEILQEKMQEGSWKSGDEVCQYHLIVALSEDQVVGGTSFYFFNQRKDADLKPTALGMGSYLAVKKDFWGNGIGTKLISLRDQALSRDARELDCHLRGLIIQVSDPALMSAEEIERDPMNPGKREEFWKRRGYRKIGFNFIQPAIRVDEPPVEYLSLYMLPYCQKWKDMKSISRDDLWDVVYCFIRCTGTVGPPETDPSYLRMRSELASHEYFQIL